MVFMQRALTRKSPTQHQAGQLRTLDASPVHLIKAYAFNANAELVRRRDPLAAELRYRYDGWVSPPSHTAHHGSRTTHL